MQRQFSIRESKLSSDLWIVIFALAFSWLFIFTPFVNNLGLRPVFGLIFVLLLPGYSVISALFPQKSDLDLPQRFLLSFLLSFAIVPALVLALDNSDWGIRLTSLLGIISLIVIVCLVIAFIGRLRTGKERAFALQSREIPHSTPLNNNTKILLICFFCGVIAWLALFAYHFESMHATEMYGYAYDDLKESIIDTGHLPVVINGDNQLQDVTRGYLQMDYLRPIMMGTLDIVCGDKMSLFPVTTIIGVASLLFIMYWLTKSLLISAVYSTIYLSVPLLFGINFSFNPWSIALSVILIFIFFSVRLFEGKVSRGQDFIFLILLFPLISRFYHAIPFYLMATIGGMVLALLLYFAISRVRSTVLYPRLDSIIYAGFFLSLAVYVVIMVSRLANILKMGVIGIGFSSIPGGILNYLMKLVGIAPKTELDQYLFANQPMFYITSAVVLIVLFIPAFLAIFQAVRGKIKLENSTKLYLVFLLFVLLGIFVLTSVYREPSRAIGLFLVPFLILVGPIWLNTLKHRSWLFSIAFVVILLGQIIPARSLYNSASQTYMFYSDAELKGSEWISQHIYEPVLTDLKTLNLLAEYHKIDSIKLPDSSLEQQVPSSMLKELYDDPRSFVANLRAENIRYLAISNDMIYSMYQGTAYILKPIGLDRYELLVAEGDLIYNNGDIRLIYYGPTK